MPGFNNILVVRTDRIGDMVLTVPALRALKTAWPRARLSVWASPVNRELVEGLPYVDEVIVEEKKGWQGYWKFLLLLRRKRFDLAVILHTKRKTNALCFFAGIPRRLGYNNDKFGFLLTDKVPDERMLGCKHEVQYSLDLLQRIGVEDRRMDLELPVSSSCEAWADAFFRDYKLLKSPVVILHPDASCPTRHWPIESYAALAQKLIRSSSVRILVVGAKSAAGMAATIVRLAGDSVVDLTGQLTLLQTAALAKRCRVFVSTDSGPAHIAAAAGAPVITLFMRSQPGINPERWRPLGRHIILLCNKPGEEILLGNDGKVVSGKFDSITVEEVFRNAASFLEK
jgi:heptosyltransferase-2